MRALVPWALLALLALPYAAADPGPVAPSHEAATPPVPSIVVADGADPLHAAILAHAKRLEPPMTSSPVFSTPADPLSEKQWTPPPEGPSIPTIQDGIGPGSALRQYEEAGDSGGYICTAAFLLRDPLTAKYYLSTAGHCIVKDAEDPGAYAPPQDAAKLMPEIEICVSGCINNAIIGGTYVTLTAAGSYHPVAFAQSGGVGLDFGIIELPASVHSKMRPWMPQWGGPTGYDSSSTGNQLVHYGHGNLCCALVGGAITHTPLDQGRTALSLGGGGDSFAAAGWASGGDSGSGVSRAAPSPTRGVQGTEAVGVLTHGIVFDHIPYFMGTTLEKGLSMVQQRTGLSLELVLQDDPLTAPPQLVYTVAIQEPADGKSLKAGSDVKVSGTATSSSGVLPDGAKVQVSLDDETFAKAFDAKGTDAWQATWRVGSSSGSHTIHARLVGADGKALATSSVIVKVTKAASGGGATSSSAPPSDGPEPGEPEEGWIEEPPVEEIPGEGEPQHKSAPRKSAPAVGPALFAGMLALAAVAARRRVR